MPSLSHNDIPGGRSVEWTLFPNAHDFSLCVDDFVQKSSDASFIGVDIRLCADGTVDAIALAANGHAVVVLIPQASLRAETRPERADQLNEPLGRLLRGLFKPLAGFGMSRLAMHMRNAFGLHIKGFDISSAIPAKKSLSPGQLLKQTVFYNADSHELDTLWDTSPQELDGSPQRFSSLILRAWFASKISESEKSYIASSGELDTKRLDDKPFNCLYKMLVEEEQINATKPRQVQGEFSEVTHTKEGDMVITNERYKTRVRTSNTTRVIMQDENEKEFVGRAHGTNGKKTSIKTSAGVGKPKITKIKVVGKEERTVAEKARDTYLLLLLQGKRDLNDLGFPLIRHLWFPDNTTETLIQKQRSSEQTTFAGELLNDSQAAVVDAMVNSSSKFVTVHGPPGTGKTSTISAAVKRWVQFSSSAWLVAQSNVGVKNIAERLCKENIPFRIIVSKDFYFEWHEDIYEESIKKQLVRTDEIPKHPPDVERLFHGVRVVLCTLSTLSNPALTDNQIFFHVPLVNLVVDEASQIGIFNYLHLFGQFKDLAKVCFFGDPKQLPPYGQEAAVTMESIFDVQHLKPHAYFLDTQYRMPDPLGNFISEAMYESKLKSSHSVKNPSCVAFVDASSGEEERKGASYMNRKEAQSIVHLVKSYYTGKNYCIITPYDGQRGHLQDELKRAELRCDNVYNVDSFQGNEADYILISIVRTDAPGFLRSKQRVNVMLTRCKKGMVIVCNKVFIHKPNVRRKTILGKLCRHWETKYGADETWRSWQEVAEKRALLPGVGASSADELVLETRPEVKPPQLTSSAKSLLDKEVDGHASSRAQRHAIQQAPSTGGITPTSSAPSSTQTLSGPVTVSRAQLPHNPLAESGRKVNAKWVKKAHLNPSAKMDELDPLLDRFHNINLNNAPMKPKDQQVSKKEKKKKRKDRFCSIDVSDGY